MGESTHRGPIPPPTHSSIAVAGFYYCTIWAARLSIIFTVVRIAPWASQKRIMLVVGLVLFLQWVLLMVQLFWVCEKGDTAWKDAPFALCPIGIRVAITQAVSKCSLACWSDQSVSKLLFLSSLAETFSDVLLIIAPLWILRNVRVTSNVRFRLVSVFACSIATSIVGLVHAVLVIRVPGVWEAIAGALEAAVALAVCNLSVIVPAIARLFGGDAEKYEESRDYATTTIGGSGGSKNTRNLNNTMLSTFKVDPTASSGAVRVDVTVEQDQANWEAKKDVEAGNGEDIYHLPLHKN